MNETRPRAYINGKHNPEYTRWWRRMNPESAYRWQKSAKGKAANKKAKAAQRARARDNNKLANKGEVICVGCRRLFTEVYAINNGFSFRPGRNRITCTDCSI